MNGSSFNYVLREVSHVAIIFQADASLSTSQVIDMLLPHNHSCNCPKLQKIRGITISVHFLPLSVLVLALISCSATVGAFLCFSNHQT